MPERPMGGDCKSPGSAFEGSNPYAKPPVTPILLTFSYEPKVVASRHERI